jgi:hypothetical protein
MADAEFSWGALGSAWWAASGAELRATETQIKFAASRHQGASATAAARLAGVTGTAVSIRQSAYRLLRTTIVSNLLSLAASEDAGVAGGITATEIDARLARMIRSPDSAVAVRAIEAHQKRETVQRQLGAEQRRQGLDEASVDLLEMQPDEKGAALVWILLAYRNLPRGDRMMYAQPLLQDLAPYVATSFPDLWRRLVSDGDDERTRELLATWADDPLRPIAEVIRRARDRYPPSAPVTNGSGGEEVADAAQAQ